MIRSDRSSVSRTGCFTHGGGIVCYVKSQLTFEVFGHPYSTIDFEMIVVIVNRQDQRKLYLINIYRPHLVTLK